jgi:hypothetical protein
VNLLSGLVSLVSVAVTGLIAVLTLRRTYKESVNQRSHQFLLAVLPRRLDALENTWRMIFELESGTPLTPEGTNQLVAASIWLPKSVKEEVIKAVTHPSKMTAQQVSDIRNKLEYLSGVPQIDALQESLIKDSFM